MKRLISALLIVAMLLVGVTACGPAKEDEFKIGFIMLHDENSTYDLNFIKAAKEVQEKLELTDEQVIIVTGIPEEGEDCYNKACELAEDGCDIVFADSFGHEDNMIRAAKEYPEVQFCHATGTKAHTEGVKNFHNAFASIYEGRYLAGIAAGMKLNEMIAAKKITAEQAKIGYVGAMPYAEVKSGMTSFFLGARSVCPTATIDVKYTNSWYNYDTEKLYAEQMIKDGCVLISQHADSMGAPTACENAGVPNVSYNGSTAAACPETFLISSRINWIPYFKYMIEQVQKGEEIATDWTGTIETESVVLTEMGKNVAEGTQTKLDEVVKGLKDGTINVFDTANFTVGGKAVENYKADVDTDDKFTPDTEVIENGIFQESKFRSAPYFDLRIDGITLLDEAY